MRYEMIQQLITTKQLSIYLLVSSLMVSGSLMRPGLVLLLALPFNAMLLIALRWAAHLEGERF